MKTNKFKGFNMRMLSLVVLITGLFLSNTILPAVSEVNANSHDVSTIRIDGASRDDIAVKVSRRGWNKTDVVFLANGFKEADILTGSPLARIHNAPILFTRDKYLPDVTLNEINRLGASKVIILGGSTSVPQHIVNTLRSKNLTVERIDGSNRYDLAANIAKRIIASEGKNRDAYVVNGDAYADAISIAPVAANRRQPIYLTRANKLQPEVQAAIPNVNSWNIIGGTASISNNVVQTMQNRGAKISNRFSGNNRYTVNRNIINYYGNPRDFIYVASGEKLADALATSALAGREGANILLVKNDNKSTLQTQTNFVKNKQNVKDFVLVGGHNTLSRNTQNYFVQPPNLPTDLASVDTNRNGKVTIKEAQDAGFIMPIYKGHWLYPYMEDRNNNGMVGENN